MALEAVSGATQPHQSLCSTGLPFQPLPRPTMPHLVVIFGPPASGKAAIGAKVAEALGYRFFHNHLTANPVAALFGWVTPKFGEVVDEVRDLLFSHAANDPQIPGVVFTFVWAFNEPQDRATIERLAARFADAGGSVHFVELLASLEARIGREGTPFRRKHKPNQDDPAEAAERQRRFAVQYTMNSGGHLGLPYPHLIIDTEAVTEDEAAARITRFVTAGSRA